MSGTATTELEKIEGIGPLKAKKLLKHFKSVKKVREASIDEISALPGIGEKDAERIIKYFSGNQESS